MMFDQYRQLILKVNDTVAKLEGLQRDHLQCLSGCSDCCGHSLTFFPIEIAHIADFIADSPADRQQAIFDHLSAYSQTDQTSPCPMLVNGRCLVYEARPLLCRTHGLMLLIQREDSTAAIERSCNLNFLDMDLGAVDASQAINQSLLSTILFQVNGLFCQAVGINLDERMSLLQVVEFIEK